MNRVVLLVVTNLAVIALLTIVASLSGVDQALNREGIDFAALLVFSALFGFGGGFISLLISKRVAKWSTRARRIDGSEGSVEHWLVNTVQRLAESAGIGTPEVAIYEGEPNAFATGAFRNSSLVAVSTGLLQSMGREEVEAVLGHEIGHVANGDMVTLTLIQGVVNTFVIFLSRIIGFLVDRVLLRNTRGRGLGYFATVIAGQIVFGLLASLVVAWFSRQREFRADAASAELLSSPRPMIAALQRLASQPPGALPQNMRALGINGGSSWAAIFSTHPPIEQRIAALQASAAGRG